VAEHLGGCADCAERQAGLVQVAAALREGWAPAPPSDLVEQTVRRVQAARRRPWLVWWRPATIHWDRVAVAATLAVVVASLLLPRLAPLPVGDAAVQQRELCFRYLGELLAAEAPGARLWVITRPGEGELVEYLRAGSAGRLAVAGWTQSRGSAAPLPSAGWQASDEAPALVLTTLRPTCGPGGGARWIVYTPSSAAAWAALATGCTWAAICPRPDGGAAAPATTTLDQAFRQHFLLLRPPRPATPNGDLP
jgi:hypothetical protein